MANPGASRASPYPRRSQHPFSGGVYVHFARTSDSERDVRLFWHTDIDPSVVVAEAEPVPLAHADAIDIARFGDKVAVVLDDQGHELALISDGVGEIQLDIRGGSLAAGPVRLRYQVEGLKHLDAKLRTLERLSAFCRLGRYPKSLFAPETAAPKWANALQAYDGMTAGASQREIAAVLFGERMVREEWNGRSDFLRLRVQRLLNYARKMVDGGYRSLLR